LQKTAPNIEVFGKILPEKEPKLPKKAVFGLFFCAEIEQKILYVRYFFSNYVEFTVRSVFLYQIMLNFLQSTVCMVFFCDFWPLFFGGNNLPVNFGRIFWWQELADNSKPSYLRL